MIGARPIPDMIRSITFADAAVGTMLFAFLFAGLWLLPDLSHPTDLDAGGVVTRPPDKLPR